MYQSVVHLQEERISWTKTLKPSKCKKNYEGLQSGDQSSPYTALEPNMTTPLPARAIEAREYEHIHCAAHPLYVNQMTSDAKPPLPPRNLPQKKGTSQVCVYLS